MLVESFIPAVKRVMSQNAMRKLTEKHYRKSSPVKKQAYERKKKEELFTNRLMADMFSRVSFYVIHLPSNQMKLLMREVSTSYLLNYFVGIVI